jgi:predicted phosphohydrolase
MALFVIGDPHLSLGGAKPMDIFRGWEDHVRRLETNWRRLVRADDTVVLPGDISWAMKLEDTLADFRFLHHLPGTKIIAKGNHDYWWSTRTKIERFWAENGLTSLQLLHNNAILTQGAAICGTRGWFFDCEEAEDQKVLLREAQRLRTSIQLGKASGAKRLIVFLHYPPITQDRVCNEMYNVLVEEGITACYYGHLHSGATSWAFRGERNGIQFQLISADALNFCPKRIPSEVGFPRAQAQCLEFFSKESEQTNEGLAVAPKEAPLPIVETEAKPNKHFRIATWVHEHILFRK